MVCLGNICRSPLAEGVLKSKIDTKHVFVDSAGTAGYHVGSPPDVRSIAIAQKFGIDISHQRCRKFNSKDFNDFDHIYVMDKSNYGNVISLAKTIDEKNKVKLLLEDVNKGGLEVPDPYYGGPSGFEKIYHMISEACDCIVEKLQLHGGK